MGRGAAGTWQDYAWRWALCHLLANNPNYADRFRPLAIALMEEKPGASFEATYGPVARELSFECDQFLETMGHGRLVAAIFHDFTLTPAIPLGVNATFTPPASGQLYLRCADDWTHLADNEGEIAVTLQRP